MKRPVLCAAGVAKASVITVSCADLRPGELCVAELQLASEARPSQHWGSRRGEHKFLPFLSETREGSFLPFPSETREGSERHCECQPLHDCNTNNIY